MGAKISRRKNVLLRREQLQQRERAKRNDIHEEHLKVWHDRERLFAETADEEQRERVRTLE